MSKELVDHFYNETSKQLQGYIGSAFRRQASEVKQHIGKLMDAHGPRDVSVLMHELVQFSAEYPGGQDNLYMGHILNAVGELYNAGIEPGSVQYKSELRQMNEKNVLTASTHTQPEAPATREQQQAGSLNAALQYQKDKLSRAVGPYADEGEVRAIEFTIGRIEAQIQALSPSPVNAQAPDKPVKSPEAMARQEIADADVHRGIAEWDKQASAAGEVELIDPSDDWDDY